MLFLIDDGFIQDRAGRSSAAARWNVAGPPGFLAAVLQEASTGLAGLFFGVSVCICHQQYYSSDSTKISVFVMNEPVRGEPVRGDFLTFWIDYLL